jgi:hypothetical protein
MKAPTVAAMPSPHLSFILGGLSARAPASARLTPARVLRARRLLCAAVLACGCGVKEVPSAGAGVGPGFPVEPPAPPAPSAPGTGGAPPPSVAPPGSGGNGGSGGSTGAPGVAGASGGPSVDAAPATPPSTSPRPEGGPFGQGATRDKVVVFLHIGHSNMAGRTTTPENLRPYFFETAPRLWSFHGRNMVNGLPPHMWRPAREPLSPDAMTGDNAGPGMGMLRAALTIAAPDVHVVSIGHGQSGMMGGTCNNYKKGGLFYEVTMAPARRLRGHVTFGGIWTMLGTTERHLDTATQRAFSDCMAAIAAAMRADLGDPEIPFLMSDFEMEATGETAPDLPYARIIIAQLREATSKIPRSALIPTEDVGMDGSHHFNLAGYREWGLRGVRILQEKGWAPWAAPARP